MGPRRMFPPRIDRHARIPHTAGRDSLRRWCRTDSALARGLRQLGAREEEGDLLARGVGTVGSVDRVALDVGAELLPDRAGRGLAAVGRAHDLAVLGDR